MSNKGVELDLKVVPVQSKNVRWEVGANYSYNKNTVESLGYGLTSVQLGTSTYAVVGQPYGLIKTGDFNRDPQGRIIIDPKTGLPGAASNPASFGTSVPPTKIGLNTSVSYKGFTFSAVMDGRFGAVIYNNNGINLDFTGVSWNSTQSGRQPFVIPNSSYWDGSKYVANTSYTTTNGNLFWAQTWNTVGGNYVNSADFWKLREVALSYTFPRKVLGHQKMIKRVTVGVTGRNVFMIRAKDNIWSDPEFANTTGNATGRTDINQLPPTKFYGANLTLTF